MRDRGQRQLRYDKRESYWPLSFIHDVNGVCVGSEREVDRALEGAAVGAGIRWDREKNWKVNTVNTWEYQRRHQKYRAQRAKAAWELVRRLPARGKRRIVTQQILPILTYGCELYPEPNELRRRLAAEIQ